MKIWKMASIGSFGELSERPPENYDTEAIRLKDGRIFYMDGMNHYPLILRLKGMGIDRDQYDSVGWVSPDGAFLSKATGKNEIDNYFERGWN